MSSIVIFKSLSVSIARMSLSIESLGTWMEERKVEVLGLRDMRKMKEVRVFRGVLINDFEII